MSELHILECVWMIWREKNDNDNEIPEAIFATLNE